MGIITVLNETLAVSHVVVPPLHPLLFEKVSSSLSFLQDTSNRAMLQHRIKTFLIFRHFL